MTTFVGIDHLRTPFADLPGQMQASAYGVEYAYVDRGTGGLIWCTPYGWSLIELLLPNVWFCHREYATDGVKLIGGTGSVFKFPAPRPNGRVEDLVIKFSRVGQDVPVVVEESFAEQVPQDLLDNAEFSCPFQEFGALNALRSQPDQPRVRTKRPLAIYSPPRTYQPWQLGRAPGRFLKHQRLLERNQQQEGGRVPCELDIHRDYILLFEWVDGVNAEQAYIDGLLSEDELHAVTFRVSRELRDKGFVVIDHKPKHIILRQRHGDGELVRRNGELAYVLVDFELLRRYRFHS